MAMIMCTISDIAAFYNFSERQLYRRFASDPELKAAFKAGRAQGRRMIRQKQFTVAVTDGDASMLKWLGMNFLGQSNKHAVFAEDLNAAELEEVIDADFEELFDEIDEQLVADGHDIKHEDVGIGKVLLVENGGSGPGPSDPNKSPEKIS